MVNFHYLYKGLCGMANAPRASSMAGHLGAAVTAGYFFGEDHPDLPVEVSAAVERDLNRIAGGEESIWFDPKKAGISAEDLFKPLPEEVANPLLIDKIATALDANIGATRQSGHNVIFASIAIRALKGHADFATPAMIDGIVKLIRAFDSQHAGRGYYGKEKGWIIGNKAPLSPEADTPAYASLLEMVDTTIGELIASAGIHSQGFGGLFHLINHAAALIELDRLGYIEIALKGMPAHRQHLRLLRARPDLEEELGKLERTDDDPFQAAYWKRTKSKQWGAWLTHRIKTLYGFHTLLQHVENPERRKKAIEAFGYLLA